MEEEKIVFTEKAGISGNLGIITLNRPKALNALDHEMILFIDAQLIRWAAQDSIKAIIIQSSSQRAFCAGGDIRLIREKGLSEGPKVAAQFFLDEYLMNHLIHHYKKPIISLLNGLTMGGGVGLSIHGSHRVATEHCVFSMPETALGFFPDIGASYFLSRCPGELGTFLGLTGLHVSAADALDAQLVTHFVFSTHLNELVDKIAETEFNPKDPMASVSEIITQFSVKPEQTVIQQHHETIATCFAHNTIEEILVCLDKQANPWCDGIATTLRSRSPLSLKVVLEQLRRGVALDLDACLQMEFRIANKMLEGHDFFEGIRALLIEKDHSPKWQPEKLSEVKQADVEAYFAPLEDGELHFFDG